MRQIHWHRRPQFLHHLLIDQNMILQLQPRMHDAMPNPQNFPIPNLLPERFNQSRPTAMHYQTRYSNSPKPFPPPAHSPPVAPSSHPSSKLRPPIQTAYHSPSSPHRSNP